MKTLTALNHPVLLAVIARRSSLEGRGCICGIDADAMPAFDEDGEPMTPEKYFKSLGLVLITPEMLEHFMDDPESALSLIMNEPEGSKPVPPFIMPPTGTLQ